MRRRRVLSEGLAFHESGENLVLNAVLEFLARDSLMAVMIKTPRQMSCFPLPESLHVLPVDLHYAFSILIH